MLDPPVGGIRELLVRFPDIELPSTEESTVSTDDMSKTRRGRQIVDVQ